MWVILIWRSVQLRAARTVLIVVFSFLFILMSYQYTNWYNIRNVTTRNITILSVKLCRIIMLCLNNSVEKIFNYLSILTKNYERYTKVCIKKNKTFVLFVNSTIHLINYKRVIWKNFLGHPSCKINLASITTSFYFFRKGKGPLKGAIFLNLEWRRYSIMFVIFLMSPLSVYVTKHKLICFY